MPAFEQLREAGYVTTAVDTAADSVNALSAGAFDLIIAEGLAVSGAIGRIRGATPRQVPLIVVGPAGDVGRWPRAPRSRC